MSDLASRVGDLSFTLPETSKAIGQILSGVGARQAGDKSANRKEAVATRDVRHRRTQGARLAGKQEASFAARGVEGPSKEKIMADTRQYEEQDAQLIVQRAAIQAEEVRNNGLASALAASIGLITTGTKLSEAFAEKGKLEKLQQATLKQETILASHPSVVTPMSDEGMYT